MILITVREEKFKILAPCDDRSQCEFLEFLKGHLEGNLSANASHMLNLLDRASKEGAPRNVDISHQIRGPIFQFEKGRIRVLWFNDEGQIIVCAHWFIKESGKTIKTKNADIKLAEAVHSKYFADKADGKITIIPKK
jgi:hypothetical protein